MNTPDPLLRMSEVAARLSVSVDTVRRRIRAGDLPAVRIGTSVRVPPEAVTVYLLRLERGA